VQELLAPKGWRDRLPQILEGNPARDTMALRSQEVVVRPHDVEVVIAPELVADLYDPSLVISPGYVGPDRRRFDRSAPPKGEFPRWLRRAMEVVLLTAIVVAPLTMITARSIPPAATGPSPTQVQSPRQAGAVSSAGPRHHTSHVFTATSQQIARAESAYQRALARVAATAVAPAAPAGGVGAAPKSDRSEAAQAAASLVGVQVQAAAAAAAQQRAAAQVQATQDQSVAQAAAAQRREARAQARAQAQVARASGKAGGDTSAPAGGVTAVAPSTGA